MVENEENLAFDKAALIEKDAPSEEVYLKNEYGDVYAMSEEDAKKALSSGWTLEAPDETLLRQRQGLYAGRELEASAAGALRGATLNLSDIALTKSGLVSRETLEGLKEYNPEASTISEIAGAVAPVLLSGGGSLAAKGAATGATKLGFLKGAASLAPSSIVSKVGASAMAATEKSLVKALAQTSLSPLAKSVVSNAIPMAASGALEGALYQAGKEISEDVLGDREFNAERFLSHVGTMGAISGVFSGGLGAVIGGGKYLVPKSLDAAKNAKDRIILKMQSKGKEEVEKIIQDLPEQMRDPVRESFQGYLEGIGQARDEAKAALRQAGQESQAAIDAARISDDLAGLTAKEAAEDPIQKGIDMRAALLMNPTEREKFGYEMSKQLDAVFNNVEKAKKAFYQNYRPKEIARQMSKSGGKSTGFIVDTETARAAARDDIILKSRQILEEMQKYPQEFSPAIAGPVQRTMDEFERRIYKVNLKDPQQIFALVNKYKRLIGDKAYKSGATPEALNASSKAKELYQLFRDHVHNADVYGEAAVREAALDEAFSQFANLTKKGGDFYRKFMDAGTKRLSPIKLNTYLKSADMFKASEGEEALSAFLSSSSNLIDEFHSSSKILGGDVSQFKELQELIKTFDKTKSQVVQNFIIGNQMRRLSMNPLVNYINQGKASLASGILGRIPFIGEYAAAAARGLANANAPAAKIERLAHLDTILRKADQAIDDKIAAIISKKTASTNALLEAAERAQRSVPKEMAKGAQSELAKDKAFFTTLSTNLDSLAAAASKNLELLNSAAPNLGSSIASRIAVNLSNVAKYFPHRDDDPNDIFDPERDEVQASDAELATWRRAKAAMENPLILLDEVKAGTTSPETIDVVKSSFPQLYEKMRGAVLDKIAARGWVPTYKERLAISRAFDIPILTSERPEVLRMMQSSFLPTQAAIPQKAGSRRAVKPQAPIVQPSNIDRATMR